jgi:hypothetical protein
LVAPDLRTSSSLITNIAAAAWESFSFLDTDVTVMSIKSSRLAWLRSIGGDFEPGYQRLCTNADDSSRLTTRFIALDDITKRVPRPRGKGTGSTASIMSLTFIE